jgi:hypothetical protein
MLEIVNGHAGYSPKPLPAPAPPPPRKRRRRGERKPRPITKKQQEAFDLWLAHGGDTAKAAKVAGTTRQSLGRQVERAMKKLGMTARKALKVVSTQALPHDTRGNANVDTDRHAPSHRRKMKPRRAEGE